MSDCLLALQQCSLIGLDDSPQLLRRSMLRSEQERRQEQSSALPQQLNFAAGKGAEHAAQDSTPASSDSHMQLSGVADRSGFAAAVQAAAGGRSTATWLDCSLPLLTSESPAIAGTKPPRSRFRRAVAATPKPAAAAAAAAAAGGAAEMAAAEQTTTAATSRGALQPSAECAVLSASIDAAAADANDCSPPAKKAAMPAASPMQEGSDTQHGADSNASAFPGGPQQDKEQPTNWSLLQQLLDDSSCSSLSCLPPELAQQSPAAAATPAAAVHAQHRQEWVSPEAGLHRDLTRSVGSDVTGFRGFWSATPGGHSRAAFSPAPVGQQPAAQALDGHSSPGQAVQPHTHMSHAASLEAPAAVAAAAAAAGEGDHAAAAAADSAEAAVAAEAPQQRNTALMMLLSLEDSQVLGRASCADDYDGAACAAAAAGGAHYALSSPILEARECSSGQQSPTAVTPAAAGDLADIGSPDPMPSGQLLRQQEWPAAAAAGAQAVSARYMAECWPSPDGSPGVLLSSPVLLADAQEGPSHAAAVSAAKTVSRLSAAAAAAAQAAAEESPHAELAAETMQAAEQGGRGCFEAEAGSDAGGGGGSRVAALRAVQQPNALEYSPIRGLTLWGDTSVPDAAQHLAAAADSPTWGQQLQREPAASSSAGRSGGSSSCAPATSSAVVDQFEQLQRLLMSSASSSGDWSGADAACATSTGPGAALMHTPQGQQQQQHLELQPVQQQQQHEQYQQRRSHTGTKSNSDSPSLALVLPAQQFTVAPASPANTPAGATTLRAARCSPGAMLQSQQQCGNDTSAEAATPTGTQAPGGGAAPGRSGSAATTPVAASGAPGPPLQLRASPAESMDSFYGAAAGEPYASLALECSGRGSGGGSVRRSLSWQAYEGLGALLDNDQPPTPGSVVCRKAWASSSGGAAGSSRAGSSSQGGLAQEAGLGCGRSCSEVAAATAAGDVAGAEGVDEDDGGDDGDAASHLSSLVALLKQQLQEAELKCTQQQMSVNEARQLVLEKELEVERLRAGLVRSEQEGTGCLEALEAALDIMTTADTGTDTEHNTAAAAGAGEGSEAPASVDEGSVQLQQQCEALNEHNAALQSTLAEAGEQLDIFGAQLQQLSAEKAAIEQQLVAMQERLVQQQAEHESFLQSELDEQQQQHEEEVRQLHDRLDELREQLQALRDAAAASKAAAEQSQAKAASLQQQLSASEAHVAGLMQQLEQLQAVLQGQESESAASSEQLSRQVAQLLSAQQELQAANARLLEAEAEYASNQLALGCRNQELSKQLQEAVSSNKRLDEANQQLQAQNASLSQMLQSMRANAAPHTASGAPTAATPTASTAQSRPPAASGMEGPTPMRRRMASVNAQLERRVQELLQQKQALALQVEQLQQQLGQQQQEPSSASPGLTEQQEAAMVELQQQVEHLTNCNDELMQQLEELDWAHEQLQAEKLELQGQVAELEQGREQLMDQLQSLQQQADSASSALATAAAADSDNAELLQQLQEEKGMLSEQCEQLQDKLAQAQQQLLQLQEQQALNHNNTALFERCKELKGQVQYLQQQLQQRDAQALRASADAGQQALANAAADELQQQELQQLQEELQHLRQQQAQEQEQHRAQEEQLLARCEQLQADLTAAQQQLFNLHSQLEQMGGSRTELAQECSRLKRVAAVAEAGMQSAQEAVVSLRDRNKSLVDQLVHLQLATPAPAAASKATVDTAVQTNADGATAAAEGQRPGKKRWTLEAGVQVDMGGTDAEQATAVQQLLLLQAQAQLHEMEEQNRLAAKRHVESKQRIAQLQSNLTQQEALLQNSEQQLRDAKQKHGRESASLQRENEQLVRQLADTRVQLQVLQTANAHLEGRVQQQQKDLQTHAAAANEAQLKLQQLTHQQHLDKLQVSAVAAELTACKDHNQQLMVAHEKEARAVAALQQKLQHAQQEGQKAAAAAVATSRAAYAALEERLGQDVHASKEQVEQLMREKNTLMVELQQTKATVDCLEDSVRRLGQQNARLVQQIKDSFAAADSSSTGATAAFAAATAAAGAAAMTTPTSAAGSSCMGGASSAYGAGSLQAAAAAGAAGAAGPVSPRTLHSIIAAATRVNEKNKKLKRQLQLAMNQTHQG